MKLWAINSNSNTLNKSFEQVNSERFSRQKISIKLLFRFSGAKKANFLSARLNTWLGPGQVQIHLALLHWQKIIVYRQNQDSLVNCPQVRNAVVYK